MRSQESLELSQTGFSETSRHLRELAAWHIKLSHATLQSQLSQPRQQSHRRLQKTVAFANNREAVDLRGRQPVCGWVELEGGSEKN